MSANSTAVWLVWWSVLLGIVVLGFVSGIEGFRNLATFAVFLLAVLSPFSLHDSSVKAMAKQPESPTWRASATYGMQIAVLVWLVWSGAFITSAAWLLVIVCGAAARELVRKERERMGSNA